MFLCSLCLYRPVEDSLLKIPSFFFNPRFVFFSIFLLNLKVGLLGFRGVNGVVYQLRSFCSVFFQFCLKIEGGKGKTFVNFEGFYMFCFLLVLEEEAAPFGFIMLRIVCKLQFCY